MEDVDETLEQEKNKININNFIHLMNVYEYETIENNNLLIEGRKDGIMLNANIIKH